MATVGVVVFPGSNCDHDVEYLCGKVLGHQVVSLWHRDRDLKNADVIVVPGGFSFGDYLRTGALATLSPIMESVKNFAAHGGNIIGICNGFQILCEAGLLPGALLQNEGMTFLSQFVHLRVERAQSLFTKHFSKGDVITCPIAHGEGNYFADAATLNELERNNQIVFRYCSQTGEVEPKNREINPNGSLNAIAGICNREGNIVGLMPHPERAAELLIGGIGRDSGRKTFDLDLHF